MNADDDIRKAANMDNRDKTDKKSEENGETRNPEAEREANLKEHREFIAEANHKASRKEKR